METYGNRGESSGKRLGGSPVRARPAAFPSRLSWWRIALPLALGALIMWVGSTWITPEPEAVKGPAPTAHQAPAASQPGAAPQADTAAEEDAAAALPTVAPTAGQQTPAASAAPVSPGADTRGLGTRSGATGDSFYLEYRLERDRLRSSEMEILEKLLDDPGLSEENRTRVQSRMMALLSAQETESNLENLLAAQGYSPAVVFLQGAGVTVVVGGTPLSSEDATRIGELVARTASVPPQNVVVMER